MKKIFVLALIFTSLSAYSQMLNEYGCDCKSIKYTTSFNTVSNGEFCMIPYLDENMPEVSRNSKLILFDKKFGNKILNLEMMGVYGAYISDNDSLIAFYHISEGHPWVEIYNLQTLIITDTVAMKAELNPYPGNLSVEGWRGKRLLVNADINLLIKNDGNAMTDKDILDKNKDYFYDITTGKYSER